jgi:hypothetical protein
MLQRLSGAQPGEGPVSVGHSSARATTRMLASATITVVSDGSHGVL